MVSYPHPVASTPFRIGGGSFYEAVLLVLALWMALWLFAHARSEFAELVRGERLQFCSKAQDACEHGVIEIQNVIRHESGANDGKPDYTPGAIRRYNVLEHADRPLMLFGTGLPIAIILTMLCAVFLIGPALLEWAVMRYSRWLNHIERSPLPPRPVLILPCVYCLLTLGLLLVYSVEPWIVMRHAARVATNIDSEYFQSAYRVGKDVAKYEALTERHLAGAFAAAFMICLIQEFFSWRRMRSGLERLRSPILFVGFFAVVILVLVASPASDDINRTSAVSIGGFSATTADVARVFLLFLTLRLFVQRGPFELIDRHITPLKEGPFRTLLRHHVLPLLLLSVAGLVIWMTPGAYGLPKALIGCGFLVATLFLGFRANWMKQFAFLASITLLASAAWLWSRDYGAIMIILPVLLLLSLFRVRHHLITVALIIALIGGYELLYALDYEHGVLNHRFVERVEHVRDPFRGAPHSLRRAANSDVPARILWAAREGGIVRLSLADNGTVARIPEIDTDLTFAFFASGGGMIGGLGVLLIYALLFASLFSIARYQRYHEHAFWTVTGVTLLLTWQSFLNIGATLSIFPLTGIPLSFIGRGTAAMIVNGGLAGLVLGYRGGFTGGQIRIVGPPSTKSLHG